MSQGVNGERALWRFVVWVTPIQQQNAQVSQDLGPKSAPHRVRLDSEIEAESLVYRVTPETPHEAKVANISGTVVLDAVIGIDGRPHNLRYVMALGHVGGIVLDERTLEATRFAWGAEFLDCTK